MCALEIENDQHKSKFQELRNILETCDAELAALKKENQHLAKIKLTVEIDRTTLNDLRDWMILECNQEIDRRVNEKFNSIAVATHGGIQWMSEQIASMIRSQLRINSS